MQKNPLSYAAAAHPRHPNPPNKALDASFKQQDFGKKGLDAEGFTIVINKHGPKQNKEARFSSGYTNYNPWNTLQPPKSPSLDGINLENVM